MLPWLSLSPSHSVFVVILFRSLQPPRHVGSRTIDPLYKTAIFEESPFSFCTPTKYKRKGKDNFSMLTQHALALYPNPFLMDWIFTYLYRRGMASSETFGRLDRVFKVTVSVDYHIRYQYVYHRTCWYSWQLMAHMAKYAYISRPFLPFWKTETWGYSQRIRDGREFWSKMTSLIGGQQILFDRISFDGSFWQFTFVLCLIWTIATNFHDFVEFLCLKINSSYYTWIGLNN